MSGTDPSAGATPAVDGATPSQTPPAPPAAAPSQPATPPATGDPDGLGDPGKRAIEAMKAERNAALDAKKAAEAELATLRAATQTDSEKAIAEAKKAGASEVTTKWTEQIRRSETKAALIAAGANPGMLDLFIRADEFGALKVDDEGGVEGMDDAIEKFRKAHPDAFTKPALTGTADGGTRGKPATTKQQVDAWSKDPAEYDKHRDEIFAWMASQGQV